MRERSGHLNLQTGQVTYRETENSASEHNSPELQVVELAEGENAGDISEDYHQRNEKYAGVDVVVECESPDALIDHGQELLGVDGIQGNAHAGTDAVAHADHRKGT